MCGPRSRARGPLLPRRQREPPCPGELFFLLTTTRRPFFARPFSGLQFPSNGLECREIRLQHVPAWPSRQSGDRNRSRGARQLFLLTHTYMMTTQMFVGGGAAYVYRGLTAVGPGGEQYRDKASELLDHCECNTRSSSITVILCWGTITPRRQKPAVQTLTNDVTPAQMGERAPWLMDAFHQATKATIRSNHALFADGSDPRLSRSQDTYRPGGIYSATPPEPRGDSST
jgi:hypothetical protein